jgi:20S proteasome alpha/beta subunit
MPTKDVKRLYEEYGRDGAIIVSPSNVIPESDEIQPPHKQAAKYYGKVADQKDGEFRVTMEHPTKEDPKPLEVEILVVEVGEAPGANQMFHVSFDGSISDRKDFAVIGGHADRIVAYLQDHYASDMGLPEALSLSHRSVMAGYERLPEEAGALEVGVLDRSRSGRKFYSMTPDEVSEAMAAVGAES